MSTLAPQAPEADFFRRIVDEIAHPMGVKDLEHRLIVANRAYCELLGCDPSQILGKTDHDLFAELDAEVFRARDELALTRGTPSTDEEQLNAKDGAIHLVTTTRAPLADANGKASHLMISFHHVARLKAAGETLGNGTPRRIDEHAATARAAHEEQASKERLIILGQLSSSLAHQIRNPLCAISNALALLRRQVDSQTETVAKQALGIAQEEVWVANRIISELLEYSRMQPAHRTEVLVREIVRGALLNEAVPEGVQVVHEVGDHSVRVDESQVRNAVAKLIRNACEAMAGRGTLTFSSHVDGDHVRLVIGDTGSGVRPETVGLVFEPLITSKPLGMGLGLTTARALVVNQGGTLECESELGKGAQFTLRLPAVSLEEMR